MRKKFLLIPATLILIGTVGIGGRLVHADSRTQPGQVTTNSVTRSDGDNLNQQVGDQNAIDTAPAALESDSAGPDADNVQSGDQSGSDAAGAESNQ